MARDTVPSAPFAPRGALRSCAKCGAVYRSELAHCPIDGGVLAVTAHDPLIGIVVGQHYRIEAVVGEGAMGRVYRARHTVLAHKKFAVKVLLGDLAVSAANRMRFAREAEATSRLDHRNIVGVHDFGRSATGLLYIAMDLVEGETLGQIMRRGPLAPGRVLRLTRQLCRGLAHAHARGVIHRDLKPDNILITAPGTPHETARISDFGLAITRDDDARLTTSGVICTPLYAAPEQLMGKPLDHRADLYALGATMFEMITGGIPVFGGDVQAVTARKLSGRPRSPLVLAPATPRPLVRVIERLLEPRPNRRPASALDVLAALDDGALEPTQPVAAVAPSRVPLGIAAGALLLAVTVAASLRGSVATAMPALAAQPPPAAAAPRVRTVAYETPPRPPQARLVLAIEPPMAHAVTAELRVGPPAEVPAPLRRTARPRRHHTLELVELDVEGGLSRQAIERALGRELPALRSCGTAGAASFTIGEARRATDIHTASPCVAAALAHVRTEDAPDIGDASVSLTLR
jgi:serine/threonine protein kinase